MCKNLLPTFKNSPQYKDKPADIICGRNRCKWIKWNTNTLSGQNVYFLLQQILDIVHTVPYRTRRRLFCRRVCSCVRPSINLNALTPYFPWFKKCAPVHSVARGLFSVIELLGSSLFYNQFPDVPTSSSRPTSACTLWTAFTRLVLAGLNLIWPLLPGFQDLRYLATGTTKTINV